MNQVKNVLSSLFEPLTKIETYENLAIKNSTNYHIYYCCTYRHSNIKQSN